MTAPAPMRPLQGLADTSAPRPKATTGAVSDGPGRGGATGLIVFGGGAGRDGAVLLGLLIVVGGGGGRFTPSAVGAAGNAENALPQFG